MWRQPDAEFAQLPLPSFDSSTLQRANAMPVFDDRVSFEEASHTYTVEGALVPRSVTGLIHHFCAEFDPLATLRSMNTERRLEKYDQASDEEILALWQQNGAVARTRGTLMHREIEWLLNGGSVDDPSPEIQQFLDLFPSMVEDGLTIYRTELSVYHRALNVAGQIDALFRDQDGHFVIVDWKRSPKISFDSLRQMLAPLDHLPDCNGSHYCLQLNLYRLFLEAEGYRVSRMYICAFHTLAQARVYEAPRLDKEMEAIMSQRFGSR